MNKILFFLLIIIVISCSPRISELNDDINLKKYDTVILSSIELEGKTIYEKNCNRCDELKEIKNYSESQWANILPDMSKKSDLTEAKNQMLVNT